MKVTIEIGVKGRGTATKSDIDKNIAVQQKVINRELLSSYDINILHDTKSVLEEIRLKLPDFIGL